VKTTDSPTPQSSNTPVYKKWLHLDGRTFLVEEVPLMYLAEDFSALPVSTNAVTSNISGKIRMASNQLRMPPGQNGA